MYFFGIISIILLFLSGCSVQPLPQSHLIYSGVWISQAGNTLTVSPRGTGGFEGKGFKAGGIITTTNDGFKIGLGPFQKQFKIQQNPYLDSSSGKMSMLINDEIFYKKSWNEFDPTIEVEFTAHSKAELAKVPELNLKYIEAQGLLIGKKENHCSANPDYKEYVGKWVSETGEPLIIFPNCSTYAKISGMSFNGGSGIDINKKENTLTINVMTEKDLNTASEAITNQTQTEKNTLSIIKMIVPRFKQSFKINQMPINGIMVLDNLTFHKLADNDQFPLKRKITFELN